MNQSIFKNSPVTQAERIDSPDVIRGLDQLKTTIDHINNLSGN